MRDKDSALLEAENIARSMDKDHREAVSREKLETFQLVMDVI